MGVENRERSGVSVRASSVHEEPSVSVRRRSVTTVEDDEPSVVREEEASGEEVVVKKKPSARCAVRSRRVVEDEPSVSVRRRTVRTYEENEAFRVGPKPHDGARRRQHREQHQLEHEHPPGVGR